MTHAVAIVPAYDRADTVGATVTALRTVSDVLDVIVVDDGSSDRTAAVAAAAGARVIELARNRGKGAAMAVGVAASGAPDAYLLIDADLGRTAALAGELLRPVALGTADMTIAAFDSPPGGGGFGFVKGFAARVLRAETGLSLAEPLSGQRALRGPLLRSLELADGFGLEIGLTLDAALRGASISEIEVGFSHRPSGRGLSGFAHRARIGRHVYRAAASRIGGPKTIYLLIASLVSRALSPLRPAFPQRHRPAAKALRGKLWWQRPWSRLGVPSLQRVRSAVDLGSLQRTWSRWRPRLSQRLRSWRSPRRRQTSSES
ncbi:glycosyltransferase [Candidatus Poriferisodalis sp.]|uniref:glycosyltransferase n=1 Tax=Candidatus Poriferisodalis sp. TaxID=3101277 RepID=UPI003AF5AD7B